VTAAVLPCYRYKALLRRLLYRARACLQVCDFAVFPLYPRPVTWKYDGDIGGATERLPITASSRISDVVPFSISCQAGRIVVVWTFSCNVDIAGRASSY